MTQTDERKMKHYTKEQKREAIDAVREFGIPATSILLDIPGSTLRGWMGRSKHRRMHTINKYPPEFKEQVLDYMFLDHHTSGEAAKAFSIPLGTASSWKCQAKKSSGIKRVPPLNPLDSVHHVIPDDRPKGNLLNTELFEYRISFGFLFPRGVMERLKNLDDRLLVRLNMAFTNTILDFLDKYDFMISCQQGSYQNVPMLGFPQPEIPQMIS